MSTTFNRRDFLFYGGATVAGITLGETGRRWLARADERTASSGPAVETWAASVCRECPAACGVRVRLMDGTPVKLEGNPLCPVGRGKLCAKGQAAIEAYFDPDRLVGPLHRVGDRGSGKWTPIAWNDAIGLLASGLGQARSAGRSVLALSAEERGPIDAAWSRFWSSVPARVVRTPASTAARLAPRFAALTGASGDPVFDLEHATHVLSFGAPVVEDWLSPVWTQRSYGRFRRAATHARGRLVQIEGRRSLTARKADEWVPLAADRQFFLAYGIAAVLLREDRVDRRVFAELGGNLPAFEADVLAHFTPDTVALATGVPVVTLLRLARDLVSTTQPLAVVAAEAPGELVDAVFALNALIGAVDRPGGVLEATSAVGVEHRPGEPPVVAASDETRPGVVVLRDASALRTLASSVELAALMKQSDLVVSFSPYLDEAAAAADLLLPTHTSLESWHALVPPSSDGTQKLACAKPATSSRLDTKDLVSILRLTAEKLGGDAVPACPFASSAEVVEAGIDGLWGLRRGVPYANAFETSWVLQLERGGWWVPPATTRDGFVRDVVATGGWVDPYFSPGQLRRSVAQHGGLVFVPPLTTVSGVVPASLESPAPAATKEPWLRLLPFTPASVNLAGSPNQPVLFELLGQPDGAPWRLWAELDPDTAAALGIADGARVRISSSAASIEAIAWVVAGTARGTVAVPFVPAIATGGRWARMVAADVRQLWGRTPPGSTISVHVTPV